MITRLLKFIEFSFAYLWCIYYKLTPKNPVSNDVLIFADLGVGDLVMYMPAIRAIYDKGYNITFKTERAEVIEILKGTFPRSKFISPYIKKDSNAKFIGVDKALKYYKFGYALLNFHQCYKHNFKLLLNLHIPVVIGHSFKENKYSKLFTDPIEFNRHNDQVQENNNLLKGFNLNTNQKMFFRYTTIDLPYSDFILVQSSSHTHSGKNCWNVFDFLSKHMKDNVILIGSAEEKEYADYLLSHFHHENFINLCGQLTIFETAFLIKKCREFHCNEGGLAHIASALNVRANVNVNSKLKTNSVFHSNLNYIYHELLEKTSA